MVPECRKAAAIILNIPPSKRLREGPQSGALPTGMQSAQKHTDPPKGRNFDRGRLPPPPVCGPPAPHRGTESALLPSYLTQISLVLFFTHPKTKSRLFTTDGQVALVTTAGGAIALGYHPHPKTTCGRPGNVESRDFTANTAARKPTCKGQESRSRARGAVRRPSSACRVEARRDKKDELERARSR